MADNAARDAACRLLSRAESELSRCFYSRHWVQHSENHSVTPARYRCARQVGIRNLVAEVRLMRSVCEWQKGHGE